MLAGPRTSNASALSMLEDRSHWRNRLSVCRRQPEVTKRRRHAFAGQREHPQLKRALPSASYFFKRGNARKKADNNKSGRDVCAGRLESLCEVGVQHDRERASLS